MRLRRNLIMFFCVLAVSVAVKVYAEVNESVSNARNVLQNISESSFRNGDGQLKSACLDDIEGISSTLTIASDETETSSKNSLYQDALNTINKLISKTDGCVRNGTPDNEDWIINCDDAQLAYTALKQLANDINALIQ